MCCNLQAGCTDALCQVSVRLVSLCSDIINRAYLHTKLSNFNPGALFPYGRLPLKVISAALWGVVRLTGCMSERHRFKGALKQWNLTQRKAIKCAEWDRKSGLPAAGIYAGMVGEVPGSCDRIPVTRQDFLKETPTAAQRVFPFKATLWSRPA